MMCAEAFRHFAAWTIPLHTFIVAHLMRLWMAA